MNQYSKESAEAMHAALLDIMAMWINPGHGAEYAGELMYKRAEEALQTLRGLAANGRAGHE